MGDNYVDFGLNNNDVLFSDDDESSLVLDFNVDGSIWEYMWATGLNSIGSGNPYRDMIDYSNI